MNGVITLIQRYNDITLDHKK